MRRRDEFDALGTPIAKREDLALKYCFGHLLTAPSAADFSVLAIDTAEITAREKYRSRAALARDTWLLPAVEHDLRYRKGVFCVAISEPARRAVGIAFSRTHGASVHKNPPISSFRSIIQQKTLFFKIWRVNRRNF